MLPLLILGALACAPRTTPPTPEAPVGPPSAFGFAPSELTASADEYTERAMALLAEREAELPPPPAGGYSANPSERPHYLGLDHVAITGFTWQLFVKPEGDRDTIRLGLVLTPDGLFLQEASVHDYMTVDPSPETPGLLAAVNRIGGRIAAGEATELTMNLDQCRAAMGDVCVNKGLYGDLQPISDPSAFLGPHAEVQAMRLGPVFKQDDGRLLIGMFMYTDDDDDGTSELKLPNEISMESRNFHADLLFEQTPPEDDPLREAGWCRFSWPDVSDPSEEVSRFCVGSMLAEAYRVTPEEYASDEDLLMTDPLPLKDEHYLSLADLRAVRAHAEALCPEQDFDADRACVRLIEAVDLTASRKSSIYEDANLGSFEVPLCRVLSGEPLTNEDLLLHVRHLSWSKNTLDTLNAAIYVRRGFQPATEERIAMFLSPREDGDPAAACLPVEGADGHALPMEDVDIANLKLIHQAMNAHR